MKERIKKFVVDHQEAVIFVSTVVTAAIAGAIVGNKLASDGSRVVRVNQLLDEEGETVGMMVHLRNGKIRPFCTKIESD